MATRRHWIPALVVLALAGALLVPLAGEPPTAEATPIATDAGTYSDYARVFPDPQGCQNSGDTRTGDGGGPGVSPWAEGTVCATDFIQHTEALEGLAFLESIDPADFPGLYPDGGRPFSEFIEIQNLAEDYADVLNVDEGEGRSAGLPTNTLERDKSDLHMIKVTDETSPVPEDEREHFVFSLSIHGIERAGAEGGIRAVEDLVQWGATEPNRPLVVTDPRRSVTVRDALRESVVYFTLSNPDGWRRGDSDQLGGFYQRYNGNGVDLNRDWPAQGYTFRPYTPLSEPETRSFAKVLQSIKDDTAAGRFTGGNDLHGQLIDRAFSFTLIGGVKRPFDKNEESTRVMQRIWADQETKLSWSNLIKPNTAPPSCVEPGLSPGVNPDQDCDTSNRVYADQWGTIWDTIDYTVTGAMGDWFDSPIGLDALGLDNEMSLSHLSNCGTGKCFVQEAEQLHVDGNKALIYAQMNLQLRGTQSSFRLPGRNAYVVNPDRVTDPGSSSPQQPEFADLPPQEDETATIPAAPGEHQFEVQGPEDGVYNGGLTVNVTYRGAQAISECALLVGVVVERRRTEETPPGEDEWTTVNADYNQAGTYAQAGMTVNVNAPQPGTYRVRLDGDCVGPHNVELDFTSRLSWPDPGQLGYDVSNMDWFAETDPHTLEGYGFTPLAVEDVMQGTVDLSQFDNIVLADDFLPGWRDQEPPPFDQAPQESFEAQVVAGAPGAGTRNQATSAFHEFDVEDAGNGELEVVATPQAPADLDLYLQRQNEDGSWSEDVSQAESGSLSEETLVLPAPDPGHYRLEVHNWSGPAGNPVDLAFTFKPFEEPDPETIEPDRFSDAQRDAYLAELAGWVRSGGNLVLTDGAMNALNFLAAPDGGGQAFGGGEPIAEELLVYAGNVQFNDCAPNADGTVECAEDQGETYARFDLAKEVNRPGAAEGADNRHQTAEPVPTGYAIQSPSGSDLNSHPNWIVDREAWEAAGGITVGQTNYEGVSLGELPYGQGAIRVIGSVLPMPTEEFDHPFGLASYGLTYTGYQLIDNALQWVRPGASWRLAGRDRFQTSAEVAYHHWNTVDTVVIASGEKFPDALVAAPLAAALDAPILLTREDRIPQPVFDYLLRRNPQASKAYVIGGDQVIGQGVLDDLERLRFEPGEIERLAGTDRYGTSVAVANEIAEVTGAAPTKAVVATGFKTQGGNSWADALASGPIAARSGPDGAPVPLLLVADTVFPESVADYLESSDIGQTLVAGGTAAVSDAVARRLPGPRRVGGRDRVETAEMLADELAGLVDRPLREATLATGENFADALVVGAPGGRDAIPTLLVMGGSLDSSPATRGWLADNRADLRHVFIAGGTAALPQRVSDQVDGLTRR